jgi:hypothetical protein
MWTILRTHGDGTAKVIAIADASKDAETAKALTWAQNDGVAA